MPNYKIPESILIQSVANESVLLEPDSGNYFTLDEVGSRMIELYKINHSIEKTAVQMACEFEVSEQTAGNDLRQLLETMQQHGLAEQV
ncbi:MAG: PqqD family protein [Cellvibrionaceae bacterium]|nr:PqqD family protein [Cellvibrionaceae bacterium]